LTCLIPQTIDRRQRALRIRYSRKPDRIFRKRGNRYARFVLTDPEGTAEIEITAAVELYRYDLSTARRIGRKPPPLTDEQVASYLASEPFVEADHPEIKAAAARFAHGGELERIEGIFRFVVSHMKYGGYRSHADGALRAFVNQLGDCTEYTDLFVALCRAGGLPARHVTGYITSRGDTPKHSWAEVYTRRHGWVPFDPLHVDLGRASYDRLKPCYIYLSPVRNDPTLEGKYHFWYYRYWGDPVRVTDEIEIRLREEQ
jgi:transglutaminase-like putative cysteine protease